MYSSQKYEIVRCDQVLLTASSPVAGDDVLVWRRVLRRHLQVPLDNWTLGIKALALAVALWAVLPLAATHAQDKSEYHPESRSVRDAAAKRSRQSPRRANANRTNVSPRLTQHLRRTAGDRVFFGKGDARLGSKARTVLAKQARWMLRQPKFGALISGYADDPGSQDANLALSAKRANAVRQRLVEEGVETHRIVVEAMGRAEAVSPCGKSICQAQNRRAVTRVLFTLPKPTATAPSGAKPRKTPDNTIPHRGAALTIP